MTQITKRAPRKARRTDAAVEKKSRKTRKVEVVDGARIVAIPVAKVPAVALRAGHQVAPTRPRPMFGPSECSRHNHDKPGYNPPKLDKKRKNFHYPHRQGFMPTRQRKATSQDF